jgi:hypothetical protein
MNMGLTVADLARDPREVAEALPEWKRGDADEAVAATLQLAARQLHGRSPVVWVWAGHTPDDCPAWVLPVLADQARDFAPRAPARMLIEMLQAAVDAGALADAVSLLNWRGLVLLTLPDLDLDGVQAVAIALLHAPRQVRPALRPKLVGQLVALADGLAGRLLARPSLEALVFERAERPRAAPAPPVAPLRVAPSGGGACAPARAARGARRREAR